MKPARAESDPFIFPPANIDNQPKIGESKDVKRNADGTVTDRDSYDPGIVQLDPAWVNVDAKNFQFKAGGDEWGVTERLKGVNKFSPLNCGTVIVWQDKEGHLFIADGHQRMGLANRARAHGQTDEIWLPARIFKESDGYTREDVKLKAAYKNIAEDSGTSVDVASIMRLTGKPLPKTIPCNGKMVREGVLLASLSDETFDLVQKGALEPKFGAVIASFLRKSTDIANKLETETFTTEVERKFAANLEFELARMFSTAHTKPANSSQAFAMALDVMRAGFAKAVASTQLSFSSIEGFGITKEDESLIADRAQILAVVNRKLDNQKTTLSRVRNYPDEITSFVKVPGGKATINLQAVKDEVTELTVMSEILKYIGTNREIAQALDEAAGRFGGDKATLAVVKKYQKLSEPAKDQVDELSGLLTTHLRKLREARVRGDNDTDIAKVRGEAAEEFICTLRGFSRNSELGGNIRRFMKMPDYVPEVASGHDEPEHDTQTPSMF